MSTSILVKRMDLLKETYFQETQSEDCLISFSSLEYEKFQEHYLKAKKSDTNFKIINVESLKSDIPGFYWDNGFNLKHSKSKKSVFYKGARTGLFKITCTEKDTTYIILFCCFLYGTKIETVNLLCGSKYALSHLMNIEAVQVKKARKPPIGIYHGEVDQMNNLIYVKRVMRKNTKTIHHNTKAHIEKDLQYFFEHIERNIKNGEKGTRKILIAGVQGTGKSGCLDLLAVDNKDKYSILFAKNLKELVRHLQLCSQYKVPCISILDDCENYFGDNNSELLNFLSGNLEPINTAGSYTIFTTNHPERLSDRIKHRPERIDEIFILSFLNEEDALAVTEQYFSLFLPEGFDYETLRGVFTGFTGAEVMKYAQDTKKVADFKYGNFEKINRAFIEQVIRSQQSKYSKLAGIDVRQTNMSKSGNPLVNSPVGFNSSFLDLNDMDEF